jgi:ketosteroid isomerase-like protein
MKTFLLLVLPLCFSFLYSASAKEAPRAMVRAAEAVVKLNQDLNNYFLGRNIMDAAGLYADDFVLTASTGQQGKAELLRELSNPSFRLDLNETTDVNVSVHGSTAVLTGLLHQRGHHCGRAFDRRLLVTNTWVRHRGSWQLMASHVTEAGA